MAEANPAAIFIYAGSEANEKDVEREKDGAGMGC
jgi:hypothetical protein